MKSVYLVKYWQICECNDAIGCGCLENPTISAIFEGTPKGKKAAEKHASECCFRGWVDEVDLEIV